MTIPPSGSTDRRKHASTREVRIFIEATGKTKNYVESLSPFLAAGSAAAGILATLGFRDVNLVRSACLLECFDEPRRLVDQLLKCRDGFRSRRAQLVNMLTISCRAAR